MAQRISSPRKPPRADNGSGVLSYWLSSLTVRRGFPPPLAPYQKRPYIQPTLREHVVSYHPIPYLPFGAYEKSPHLQVLQSFPFTGHTYPFPISIAQHRVERGHRVYPRLPLAFGMSTLTGPAFGPLHEGDLLYLE